MRRWLARLRFIRKCKRHNICVHVMGNGATLSAVDSSADAFDWLVHWVTDGEKREHREGGCIVGATYAVAVEWDGGFTQITEVAIWPNTDLTELENLMNGDSKRHLAKLPEVQEREQAIMAELG